MDVYNRNKNYDQWCSELQSHFEKKCSNINSESKYIVSLTSYGYRLNTVWLTLQSVFDQTCSFAKVILWVAEDEKNLIGDKLIKMQEYGLTIMYCNDIKSYKKLVYTVQNFNHYNIITIDDDVLYPVDYFERLINLHNNNLSCICCYRAHEIKFFETDILPYKEWGFHSPGIKGPSDILMPIGVGGILYPSGTFSYKDFDFEVINNYLPYSDDIYFKWLELDKGIKTVKVFENGEHYPYYIKNTQEISLKSNNVVNGNNNDTAIKNLEMIFGIRWYDKIYKNFF